MEEEQEEVCFHIRIFMAGSYDYRTWTMTKAKYCPNCGRKL